MPRKHRENPAEKYQFMHHFVPHPVHRTRATLLSHHALFLYAFLSLALFLVLRLIPIVMPGVLGYASDINTADLLVDTNRVRTEHNLAPLKLNDTLSKAAQKKAEHMFQEDYWAHVSPAGVKPWDFILGQGYDYIYAGENLAKNFDQSDQVVDAWYKSPSHRENLLSDNYDEIGFAIVNGVLEGYETTLVVQMFGKARVPTGTASIEPPENAIVPSEVAAVKDTSVPVEVPEEAAEAPQNIRDFTQYPTPKASPHLTIDLGAVSRVLLIAFVTFITILLVVDIWYSRSKSIPRVNAHTLAHLMFLLAILGSVWLVLSPGKII